LISSFLFFSFLFFSSTHSPFNNNSYWVHAIERFKFISFDDWYLYKNDLFISWVVWTLNYSEISFFGWCACAPIVLLEPPQPQTFVLVSLSYFFSAFYFTFFSCTQIMLPDINIFKNHLWYIGHNSESIMSKKNYLYLNLCR
jgi:hypothetical protein